MKPKHWCSACKGTGKIVREETRIIRGQKRNYAFAVDCPGLLAQQFDTGKLPIGGQDRAAGEKERENG